jgi:hypothetical protein
MAQEIDQEKTAKYLYENTDHKPFRPSTAVASNELLKILASPNDLNNLT